MTNDDFTLMLQRGANTVLNVTFCSSEYHDIWRGTYIGYTSLLLVALMIFSFQNQRVAAKFKNSRVAARFVEEGNSTARVTFVSVLVFFVLYVIIFALENNPLQYTTVFWVDLCWSLLLPLLLLFVISFPKVFPGMRISQATVYIFLYVWNRINVFSITMKIQ